MDAALELRMAFDRGTVKNLEQGQSFLRHSDLVRSLTTSFERKPLYAVARILALSEIPYTCTLDYTNQIIEYIEKHLSTPAGFSLTGKETDLLPCYNAMLVEAFSKLASILDVSMLKKDEQHGCYIIDSVNDLWLEFCDREVIIYYSREHHHIMGMDFATVEAWASEVDRFLRLFVYRTVRFEYFFKGDKQIRVKLYSLHDGREELIEHIRTTLNPVLLLSKDLRRETVRIEFRQQ